MIFALKYYVVKVLLVYDVRNKANRTKTNNVVSIYEQTKLVSQVWSHTHLHTHIHIHSHTHTYIHTHTHTYTHIHIHSHTYT